MWSIINIKYNLRRTCILESLEEVCFLFQFKSCFEVFTLVKFRLCTRTMFHPFVCPELGTVVARARQRWPVLSQIADQIWDLYTYAKANSRKLTLARLLKFIFFLYLGIFQVSPNISGAKVFLTNTTYYYFIIVPIERKLIIRVPREPWIYFREKQKRYLRLFKNTIRVTVRWIGAVFVFRPKPVNAKISCWLPWFWVATALLCITVRSWPLHAYICIHTYKNN